MKRYVVELEVEEGKIPMIKVIKRLTNMSLADTKDFVEARMSNWDLPKTITVLVTEQQLGKYLICELISGTTVARLISATECAPNAIDLTSIVGRP